MNIKQQITTKSNLQNKGSFVSYTFADNIDSKLDNSQQLTHEIDDLKNKLQKLDTYERELSHLIDEIGNGFFGGDSKQNREKLTKLKNEAFALSKEIHTKLTNFNSASMKMNPLGGNYCCMKSILIFSID
jgi:predicted RNase H-like nuclease (RuvC/YqgF family)